MDVYSPWLQPSDNNHDGRSSAPPGATPPTHGQPNLDLSELAFGDLTDSTNPLSTPSASFFQPYQQNYFISGAPGPYNAIPYGSSPWPSTSQVPVSSYSTLNGATTSPHLSQPSPPPQHQQPPPQHQPQQQQAIQPQHMVIDPALTTMSSSSPPPPPQYSNSPLNGQTYDVSDFLRQLNQPGLGSTFLDQFIRPAGQSTPPVRPEQTLSPHVLHNSPPPPTTIAPSAFYTPQPQQQPAAPPQQPPTPPTPTEIIQAKKDAFQSAIRPLLAPDAFSGAKHVQKLVGHIDDYGSNLVDAPMRLEILTKMRDNAGNHYFRAWSESPAAMDVTREWLKAGMTGKSEGQLRETIMPLLHIIDRLPLTIESLKTSKLGKIIVKLVKDPPSPAIKDMASNLERRWRQMVNPGESKQPDKDAEDPKSKKRKVTDPKAAPPLKKQAISTSGAGPSSRSAPATATVKKEAAKPVVTAVKDAKSDSSFFSAPKPKPKLPTFKKAPPKKDEHVAQPSAIDPFQEALKDMAKARRGSPATASTPPSATTTPAPIPGPSKLKKKGKTVSWAPEGQLEMVKLIDRAIYDDDAIAAGGVCHNVRQLDRDEGAAMHVHLFDETVDWSEPQPVEFPPELELFERGSSSQEKDLQAQREQTALVAIYMSLDQIPPTPGEPVTVIPEDQMDKDVKAMIVGSKADPLFWSGAPPPPGGPAGSVADLVGQLTAAANGGDVHMADGTGQQSAGQAWGGAGGAGGYDTRVLQNMPPDQLQMLLQQAQVLFGQEQQQQQGPPMAPPAGGVAPPYDGADHNWDSQYQDYGHDGNGHGRWDGDSFGGRGRGRGRGRGGGGGGGGFRHNKRTPCSFFMQGRCKYGDRCDFSHDPQY
ncbi:hypothetical protein PUNSTDRAFT_125152 [Punctularia strigosozonata HHB-11173 SS5]|uniref:uncharacterized protein n=1 Tax=Punctularia strigosozonata (strain HHB-11173) TaxID=741275 RepID=UPI0004416D83|nr:uncharacterized protein PUNSTDRAFT_125152 [Punctularia strigosozonata HHB-11173 SS5]EIN10172.1 hypothetical protein PUNSTDRAFT_125152 [Punctularia strigosozonata HHB-11173 SS5]